VGKGFYSYAANSSAKKREKEIQVFDGSFRLNGYISLAYKIFNDLTHLKSI